MIIIGKQGWIKLYRQLQDHWIWESDEPFDRRSAWIDLLFCANHDEKKASFGKELITVKRGSFITSIRKISSKWKWSRHKVANFLNLLESDHMISKQSDASKTLINVLQYEDYQEAQAGPRDANAPKSEPLRDNSGATAVTRGDTNKNIKNIKNDKKERREREAAAFRRPPDSPFPTLKEVSDYCSEQGVSVDPEIFWNYHEAKGWILNGEPIQNWKAVLKVWEKREIDHWSKRERVEMNSRGINERDRLHAMLTATVEEGSESGDF